MGNLIFSELAKTLGASSSDNSIVAGIAIDSRQIQSNHVFFAMPGTVTHGIKYAQSVLDKGALTVISDVDTDLIPAEKLLLVPDIKTALLKAADWYYNYPTANMKLIGITGTNGKTSTTFLTQAILKSAQIPCGVIGTTGYWINQKKTALNHTTPDPISLAEIFAEMRAAELKAVAMEVSSHALDQKRVHNLAFTCSVFTNLTRDHIDYHATFDAYRDAKARLFAELTKSDGFVISNVDDVMGQWMIEHSQTNNIITYGTSYKSDLRIADAEIESNGSWVQLTYKNQKYQLRLNLAGRFNLYNAAAAFGVGISLGIDPARIIDGIQSLKGIPGRFEQVDLGQDFQVVVDYAHTPDALENLLKSAREVCKGRLIVVFGCGGDRDKGKRPLMGRIAAEIADSSIVTSDNPRTEEPNSIISEIEGGYKSITKNYKIEPDRKKAIIMALEKARTDDMIVIAGKGHEDYQILGTSKIHFSDREIIESWLQSQGYNET